MSLRQSLDPRSSMWHLLAHYLHFLRVKHDLSCAGAGRIAKAARQTVSHWEAGRLKPSEDQVAALDREYGTGDLLSLLLCHAKTGHDPDWLKTHLELEARASVLRIYELGCVPGLLQTEDYARTLFVSAGLRDVEGQVARRMERQRILGRDDPPHLWVLLAEPVLEWQVGGSEVMGGQLIRLLEMSELPNVVLRVIPKTVGAHLGLNGSFKIMRIAGSDLAYTEAMGGGRLVQGSSEVETFQSWYDHIGAVALPVDSSRELMRNMLEIS
ncbi:helix-turn-helix domain-containing protein [Actinomadura sp. HBU206391]|uniref:helix-turn-helix domain-containing protein n=1 Tax=Actinomadura sp. HBU206391 TaxID=2731692 RepID=UPI00164F5E81|nr:helix-turn-helix transcriptional regulator [Actinomadura sp. HBU206391]MBC6459945.1 helix-turn-helix domain-containing protein [Actinomadura sp. HBU206391]